MGKFKGLLSGCVFGLGAFYSLSAVHAQSNPIEGQVLEMVSPSLAVSTTAVAVVPFVEDFETSALGSYWEVSGTAGHRSMITSGYAPYAGTNHFTMDRTPSGTYSRNELTLTVDLEGYTDVVLSFWAKDFGDEPHGPPSAPFVDHADFDGVAVSADGTNWYEVSELRTFTTSYAERVVDLDAAIETLGISYSSYFKIRFNQYDNYPMTSDGLAFDNISITGELLDDLRIDPRAPQTFFGYEDGPFSPSNLVFSLSNQSTNALSWTVSSTPWLIRTSDGGVLDAGSNDTVQVALRPAVTNLQAGTYDASVKFKNEESGFVQNIPVRLIIEERVLDHFDWAPIGTNQIVGIPFPVVVTAKDGGGQTFTGFTNTASLSLVSGGQISTIAPSNTGHFVDGIWSGSLTVFEAASNVVLRADDGANHIGDSNPFDVNPLMLSVALPEAVKEGGAAFSAQVIANYPPESDLLVYLSANLTNEVALPPSVILPAGQTNVSFEIVAADDSLLDGTVAVSITASSTNLYQSGSRTLLVHDDETATLTLFLPQTTYEGIGSLEGSLLVDSPPASDFLVELRSGDTNEIAFSTVVIPAGQTMVPIEFAVVDDEVMDGVQTVVLEASVENWTGDSCHVFVFDNEQAAIAPEVPEEMKEGAMPWPMYQGNKEHTGYVPVSLAPERSKELWSKTVGSGRSLNPVTIAEGKVYASIQIYHTAEDHLFVLDALTGEQKWMKNFGSVARVNPPSYAYGNVYIQTGNHSSDTYLHAYNAETGTMVFKSPHSAQWESYYAPTIEDDVVYINGGSYGGMYAFDAHSGTQNWFANLAQYDEWTPTVGPDYAYCYVGGTLSAINKTTGAAEFTISDPNFDWHGWSMDTVAVYGDTGLMHAVHYGRLITFDTQGQRLLWQNSASFKGQPSYDNDVVYALNGNGISAVSASINQILWNWVPAGGSLSQNIIVTDSHLIVGSASKTYMVDLDTHQEVWSYPKGGHLSLAESVLYIASANGELAALSVLPRLEIEIAGDATEGDGIVHMAGEVRMEEVLPDDLVVDLFSSDSEQVMPVGPLTIPAGQTNAAFNLQIMDDDLLDGSQLITIGVRSDGYADASDILWVHDNEFATLSLTLPQSTVEGSGGISGMVHVTPIADRDIVVSLLSDNPGKIAGGLAVIKAGDSGAAFTLSVLDDDVLDHLQTATIEARVENWESAIASVFIADNETTEIQLALPSLTMEGDGIVTNAGEVMLPGTSMSDVHILLRSLDSSEVEVPSYVTIPAGQSNAFFNITAVDDDVVDGKQYPVITASAPGLIPGSQSMRISDNEFHHFTIIGFSGEDPGYLPLPCSVQSVNMDDEYVNTYSGPAWLSGELGENSVAVDPTEAITLTNGLWQGTVTFHGDGDDARIFTDDGAGHLGTNEISLAGFNIVKMATDWELPYIYMVHRYESSPNKSILIWYNTDTEMIEHALSAGENATDLTVHYGDDRIYVSNAGHGVVRVFDRTMKTELPPLSIGSYARVNAGRPGLLFVENGSTLRAYDTANGSQVASARLGYNTGDGDCSLDGAQYYHCDNGTSGSKLYRIDVSADTYVTQASIRTANYYGSDRVFVSMDGKRVYNCKHVYDADLNVLLNIGSEIYAASAYGDMVLTSTKAYNGVNGEEVYSLPFSTSVMAFSGDQSELLLFNATSGSITSIATSAIMPIPKPTMIPFPADGSLQGANLPELAWSGAPAAIGYDVYIGTDSNAVASASTNGVQYLGRMTGTEIQLLEDSLAGNQTYFWRVDIVGFGNSIVGGQVWTFDTAAIAVNPYEIVVDGVSASYTQTVSVAVSNMVAAPVAWTVSTTNDWVLLGASGGMGAGMLDIGFDLSSLEPGEHTAEITFDDGSGLLMVPVTLSVEKMRIVKMATDWTLPYIYMAHTSATSPNKARLIWYNTDTDTIEHVLNAGENITDLTVNYADNRIYVSNWKRAETRVFDRSSKEELDSLLLGSDVYHIDAAGAGRVITEEEDQWITVRMRDTTTSASLASRGEREGDGECTLDGRFFYHTDNNSSGARLSRFTITNNTFASEISIKTKSYYGSRNVIVSMDGSRVYNCSTVYDADLKEKLYLGAEIYAASAYGDLVMTGSKGFNGVNGDEIYSLPFSTSVMAFSGDQSELLLFNSTAGSITSLATSVIMPIPEPNMIPVPEVGSVQGANLPELAWTGAPASIGYDVYLGTDSNAVAAASKNSIEYLGRNTDANFQLPEGTLTGNETYYWRVDIVAFGNSIVGGEVWNFGTASIAADPYLVIVDGVAASYTQTVSVAVNSTVGSSVSWTASCTNDWVLLGATNGTASGVLEVAFNFTDLSAGKYTAEISFSDGARTLAVPIELSVENMRIVKMATDWTKPYVYMAHTSATSPNKSRLIWYNTETETIEHVVDAGENATDLTVHYGEDRIYVSNWKRTETRVFGRSSRLELEPLLLGGDVYHINAGATGRVITEGEDQWVRMSMRNTTNSSEVAYKYTVREGDADSTLDGRYHYHCDNNSSGATIQKYDMLADTFAQVASRRTKYYYGSRNIFVSKDGSRVFNCGTVYDSNLVELKNLAVELYAATSDGGLVSSASQVFNSTSGELLKTLPFSSTVMAVSYDDAKLVGYIASSGQLEVADISGLALPDVSDYLAWQMQYFPEAETNDICSLDDDHDGQCDLAEYIAGTDPTEADSCFMIYDAVPLEDGSLVIYWDAVSNRVYNVNYSPSLIAPFQSLETGIHYPQDSYTDRVDRAESSGFYRVGVQKEN